ncbi:MAG: UDP-N-acetylmuramoyl-tripeptide--D-alanyl-D-alanine ligase [Gammaproteobacteria bacterium]|tara:strand:- start:1709 stop:3043 length:1335 start_codon:yes stop_codon:yes gene_type:complete
MDLLKLADISKGRLFGESLNINGFSIDTRSIKNNDLFIALKGENFDGHEFISEAIAKGAAALVVNKSIQSDVPQILVENTYEFIKQVALFNRKQFTGKMIGITGTNGKTTSKQITSNLLSQTKFCHKTIGNKNNQIGVPFSLLTLEESHEFSVIEMGTSEPGEIAILNDQVKPDIAAITNVSMGHLDGLRDTESIAAEKGNILEFYPDNGVAILPRDSEFFDFWCKRTNASKKISFGYHQDSDFRVTNIESDIINNLTHFDLYLEGQKIDISMNGIGKHNALNAALSLAIGVSCGLNIKTIKHHLKLTDLPERRLAVSSSLRDSIVIDDSYNSNPASLKNALDLIEKLTRKKICVLGEMRELGSSSDQIHQDVYEYASKRVDKILCIGEAWKLCKPSKETDLVIFENHEELFKYLVSIIDGNTIILVKGSRSTRMDLIADKLKI